jgi:hypothetical protein
MNEVDNNQAEKSESAEEPRKKSRRARPARKSQSQLIQEALGLKPEDIKTVEDKLSVVKFLDYISEESLDFIYKDRTVDQYLTKISEKVEIFDKTEEDKLLKKSFEEKKIVEVVRKLKAKTEEIAFEKGIKNSVDKRLRNLNLMITIPMLAVATLFLILPYVGVPVDPTFMLPILCVFCMAPQFVRQSAVKKWYRVKEESRNDIYTANREDILVVKSYVSDLLSNIRSGLIELEVPLDLIKFSLYNSDYDNLNIINQRPLRGLVEYYVSFKYPEGMEPLPIPEQFKQFQQPQLPAKVEKPEKNFVVLTEMKGKDGIISSFEPVLKVKFADQINSLLSDSEFSESPLKFDEVIPNYSEPMVIYCVCGEIADIDVVNICTWKEQFKFYLFEGKQCKCGDTIYALSLMDEDSEVPSELSDIFN